MKYKVGDKVKYDSGDWLFYGAVSAVIENSVFPFYRLNIERMEKKNCQFPISLFEFELESINETDKENDLSKLENLKIEFLKKQFTAQNMVNLPGAIIPETIQVPVQKPELLLKPEPIQEPEPAPEAIQPVENPELKTGKPMKKRDITWYKNLEMYIKGVKSNTLYTWVVQNRKQYKAGILKEDRFESLVQANFPFEAKKRAKKTGDTEKKKKTSETLDIWDKQFRQWKSGDNRASLQQWRQKNVKRFVDGKLSKDKIEKLKEVGILK